MAKKVSQIKQVVSEPSAAEKAAAAKKALAEAFDLFIV